MSGGCCPAVPSAGPGLALPLGSPWPWPKQSGLENLIHSEGQICCLISRFMAPCTSWNTTATWSAFMPMASRQVFITLRNSKWMRGQPLATTTPFAARLYSLPSMLKEWATTLLLPMTTIVIWNLAASTRPGVIRSMLAWLTVKVSNEKFL